MLQCPKQTFARLFYNVSSSFFLLLLFFHFTSIFLARLFIFFGGNPFYDHSRTQLGYDFSDEEEIEEEEEEEEEDGCYGVAEEKTGHVHAADICSHEEAVDGHPYEPRLTEEEEESDANTETSKYSTPTTSQYSDDDEEEEILERGSTADSEETNLRDPTTGFGTARSLETSNAHYEDARNHQQREMEIRFEQEDNFLVFQPPKSQGNKVDVEEGTIYEDTFTIGSTSKDSSEWRSSINCRDSGTDDPFSSSSRRSCPKWESYTVFQKYDEEMLFLDRMSAQKLQETESLRSIQVCPRSLSERVVHKLRTKSKRSSADFQHNPYRDLEAAYVAQICLTWETLHWNYKYFQRLRASRREFDPGCPAYVAQLFQQFQVLLQRFIENEPYEYGRRPEIYARKRKYAPKLLQVPEYRDSDDDKREEGGRSGTGGGSRIPSTSFLAIMEESIRTFMNFLKQDKKSRCQILADLFRRNRRRRGSADATLLLLLKKVNKKKKAKLKEGRRSGKWQLMRRRKVRGEEELENLMALIDLKVVSRVLRMGDLNDEQLHWCESKMSRVRVSDGKLERDSVPLFFPAH